MRIHAIAAALAIASFAVVANAEEKPVPLEPGAGRDAVEANCGACHSLDYVRINAPFMNGKVWDAEVTKMIKAFGAPIDPADAKTITDYLSRTYGTNG